jgi:hypothetical protein
MLSHLVLHLSLTILCKPAALPAAQREQRTSLQQQGAMTAASTSFLSHQLHVSASVFATRSALPESLV